MGLSRLPTRIGALTGLAIVLGGLAAVLWSRLTRLPAYVVHADFQATMSERELTSFVSADAWFTVIGLVAGLAVGWVAWAWFRSTGWVCAVVATAAGLLAGLVCWGIGELLGPGAFDARMYAAQPGDLIPVALQLRSPSALAAWSFTAVAPTLFASSLGPEPAPRRAAEPRVPDEAEPEPVSTE